MIAAALVAFAAGVAATLALAHFATRGGGSISLSWGPWTGFWRIAGTSGEIRRWTAGWLSLTYLPFDVDALLESARTCSAQRLSQEVGEAMGGARRN